MSIDYYSLYKSNHDFKGYVDRYCTKHGCTVSEALNHVLVQMAGKEYKEQENLIRP